MAIMKSLGFQLVRELVLTTRLVWSNNLMPMVVNTWSAVFANKLLVLWLEICLVELWAGRLNIGHYPDLREPRLFNLLIIFPLLNKEGLAGLCPVLVDRLICLILLKAKQSSNSYALHSKEGSPSRLETPWQQAISVQFGPESITRLIPQEEPVTSDTLTILTSEEWKKN